MATEPVNSLDEQVNECWARGQVGATVGHRSPPQSREAPRAEPEEDVDVLESGVRDQTLRENQTPSTTDTGDATKLENQESAATEETVAGVTEKVPTDCENYADEGGDSLPPTPPPLMASSNTECFEEGGVCSLAGEVPDCVGDGEITSDPMSPDREWAETTQLMELLHHGVDAVSEEMTDDHMTAEEKNDTRQHFLQNGLDNRETEMNAPGASRHSSSDSNDSDDIFTVRSPPFADESEEEEGVSMDITSCQQRWSTLDVRCKPSHPSPSVSASDSAERDPSSPRAAVASAIQQGALTTQSQGGANQEAARQVRGQGSPPLSPVAMEPSNRGGAASQGFGCHEAVRGRHSWAEERTEEEGELAGGEEAQTESESNRSRAIGQHGRGQIRYSHNVRIQEPKTETSSCGIRMESDTCEDSQSDSGVSADFSPCSTLEGNTAGTAAGAPKETPIEREIRRAVAREHSLRRSRGLPNPPTSPEYVEIPLKTTALYQPLDAKAERGQGKDRQYAGKKMQHEIHEEARREQDLVKIGKVPGFYDKGTVRQLEERKQLFEAFQKSSEPTGPKRPTTASWSQRSGISTSENWGETGRRHSVDLLTTTESVKIAKRGDSIDSVPRGAGFSKGTGGRVIVLESTPPIGRAQELHQVHPEAQPVTTVDSGRPNIVTSGAGRHGAIDSRRQEKGEEEEVASKDNPFFKLRSSTSGVKVEQDIREAQERETELRKQRISVYGGTGGDKGGAGGGERPAGMAEQIPTLSSSSLNRLAVPDVPDSSPRLATGPSAAHESAGKLGIWPPAEEGRTSRQEVLRSPRTPRQKTPLVQRWESGLLNGHNMDED